MRPQSPLSILLAICLASTALCSCATLPHPRSWNDKEPEPDSKPHAESDHWWQEPHEWYWDVVALALGVSGHPVELHDFPLALFNKHAPTAPPTASGGKISLNTATLKELESLPEIGPKPAAAIIAGRPYKSVTDVLNVAGIGQKAFQTIAPLVRE